MENKVHEIELAWHNAVTSHKTLGEAMSAVKQLETSCRKYLVDKIEHMDLPREYRDRIMPVLEKFNYRIDPKITPEVGEARPPIRIEQGRTVPAGFLYPDPVIKYTVNLKKTPDEITADLDEFVSSLFKVALPSYLKPSKSMRQLLVKLLENLNYEIPEEGSNQTNVAADDLKRMLLNYFDIRIIDNVADYDRNSDDLYFEFEKNPHIQSPFITQPAVISEVNGKKEVLIKGTMLLPSKSIG